MLTKEEDESIKALELANELVYHLNNGHRNCQDFFALEQLGPVGPKTKRNANKNK